MDPAVIKMTLECRGNFLNVGVDPYFVIKKAKEKNIEIDPYIISVFSKFNGFQDGALDPNSGIRIWPLEATLDGAREGRPEMAFADFLMNSNEYTFNIEDALLPVRMEEEVVAKDFPEFLQKMTSGQFDCL